MLEYYEVQKINKYLMWLIILFAGVAPIASFFFLFITFPPLTSEFWLDKDRFVFVLAGFFGILVSVFIIFLFLSIKLELRINSEGIHFRLFPFHKKFRKISFSEIKSFTVRTFHPILEYGGWGIRYSVRRNGVAYTISGRNGLQIELNSLKRLMIGIKQPKMVLEILNKYIPEKYFRN
ncbi:MAG: hypothetical protein N2517_00270 [Ignavibacteria bacterium]|nr:hypothetical protein [Ignavibacteria bacterium]